MPNVFPEYLADAVDNVVIQKRAQFDCRAT